ncbi:MAG: hypothetical protein M3O36_11815, partial [Myxococcota bacterium]|nr:hypothetical protein [Myxococcota bacterium]
AGLLLPKRAPASGARASLLKRSPPAAVQEVSHGGSFERSPCREGLLGGARCPLAQGAMSGALIRLEFSPDIELIARAREFVSDFYESVISDPDAVSRVALATQELLENVLKYSSDGKMSFETELVRTITDGSRIWIRAHNRTTVARATELRRIVTELEEAPNPLLHYHHLMRRSALRDGVSGLGLARIRVEAEMNVHCDVRGEEVTVTAESRVPVAVS